MWNLWHNGAVKQTLALNILKSGRNVFLTGEPGSGKTYVINQYVDYLHSHGIKPAVTASTGIAATHIGGMTIHSWSGIGIRDALSKAEIRTIAGNDYVKKRVEPAKVLIIDEISMLAPNVLQMIDAICREIKKNDQPFGGVQVVLVGDFFQLPPVIKRRQTSEFSQENIFDEAISRFAYESPIWESANFVTCYITEQYRQDDPDLVAVLSKIRTDSFDNLALEFIGSRKTDMQNVPNGAPKLYSHNIDVDRVNDLMLAKIDQQEKKFVMYCSGHDALVNAMKKGCLSPEILNLKIGASVMFTKNNQKEGYVNGTLGVIDGFNKKSDLPIVKTRNGQKIEVDYAEWLVEEDGKIKGRLSQIPLRLAWAITVHKSQGISLDEAIIDLSKVFEYGQGYVAISRVKRLSGVYILGWNEMAFMVDPQVLKKDKEFRVQSDETEKIYTKMSEKEIKYQQNEFIILCEGEIDITKVVTNVKKPKISTYDETLKLWKKGKDISEIAKIRNLADQTIWSHIEHLVEKNLIKRSELMRIAKPKLKKDFKKIQATFKKLNTDKLTPVYEYFWGEYSYNDIKLAKMMRR